MTERAEKTVADVTALHAADSVKIKTSEYCFLGGICI